ncbi:MAG: tRNA preQ1(34) S-adenosylmethionine ribosyltransferase-isomerase QueA [Candidatus Cloacimonetes bacterium 4572_55]|nr:MAG: tRNA preQ1(34) S-adenosylmethionine ribosyltransferase-isomerase QueA [Candidatus Cloacimonetes bacterium 4572_55]
MNESLRTNMFDYKLPEELIAQHPLQKRDQSRLMTLDRKTKQIRRDRFSNLADYLREGDLLIMNATRVIPARLNARRLTGGKIEIFLIRQLDDGCWETLVKPGRKVRVGDTLHFEKTGATAHVLDTVPYGGRIIRFDGVSDFFVWLESEGKIPLPPYIKREVVHGDRDRYQTIYANEPGAVAAPTAGLHFTEEGVEIAQIILHVGLGTFRPVTAEIVEAHQMETEYYSITKETANKINRTKLRGGRIIATGTTCVRALESAISEDGWIEAVDGRTDIFIYPPYQFRAVDCLITNFHLPKSTLLMLVSAFATKEFVLRAYEEAIAERYRLYSYGDAMLIL